MQADVAELREKVGVSTERGLLVEKVTRETRNAWFRLLRRGKYLLGHDPATLPILLRLTPMGISRQITEHTELVVEGFPRSGNTFMVTALLFASDHRLRISSHVHHPSQVKLAVQRGLPTALVVRDPLDTLASYLTYGQHGRPATSIREYCSYHRELLPYLDQLVVCDFDENVANLSASIARLNQRFGTELPPFEDSPENTKRVFDEIAEYHRLTHPKLRSELVAPRPTDARRQVAERHRAELERPRHAGLMADARDLYGYYLQKIAEQRAEFEKHVQAPTVGGRNGRTTAPVPDGANGRSRSASRAGSNRAIRRPASSESAGERSSTGG